MVRLAPSTADVRDLDPAPPWTAWAHGDSLWPWPDDHDGDLIVDSEPAVVGFAAAVYPAIHAGSEATVDETEAFIDAYLAARAVRFDRDDVECCWAAGVWIRAFDAKKQVAKRQPVRSLTEPEARDRLARAGCH